MLLHYWMYPYFKAPSALNGRGHVRQVTGYARKLRIIVVKMYITYYWYGAQGWHIVHPLYPNCTGPWVDSGVTRGTEHSRESLKWRASTVTCIPVTHWSVLPMTLQYLANYSPEPRQIWWIQSWDGLEGWGLWEFSVLAIIEAYDLRVALLSRRMLSSGWFVWWVLPVHVAKQTLRSRWHACIPGIQISLRDVVIKN